MPIKALSRWAGGQSLVTGKAPDVGSSFFVQTDPINLPDDKVFQRPRSAWGFIQPKTSQNRMKPPVLNLPYNGDNVSTEDTWFDAGHLIALTLGGSDDEENIVPQASTLNRHAGWRRMEEDYSRPRI